MRRGARRLLSEETVPGAPLEKRYDLPLVPPLAMVGPPRSCRACRHRNPSRTSRASTEQPAFHAMCASSDDLKSHRDPKLPLIPARQPPRRSGSCQRPLEQGPPEGRTYFVFIARRYRVPVTKDIKYSVGTLQKCYKSHFAGVSPFLRAAWSPSARH